MSWWAIKKAKIGTVIKEKGQMRRTLEIVHPPPCLTDVETEARKGDMAESHARWQVGPGWELGFLMASPALSQDERGRRLPSVRVQQLAS